MSYKAITDLSPIVNVAGSALVEIAQAGSSYQASILQLKPAMALVIADIGGVSAFGQTLLAASTISNVLDELTTTPGSIAYRGAVTWAGLGPGTPGQVLQTNGSVVQWATVGGVGTVTSITFGTGLTGGTVTGIGNVAFDTVWGDARYISTTGATMTGLFVTVASASGGAGLRLPHGAAPSAPVNGDMWTTTGGLFARINGTTVGYVGDTRTISTTSPLAGGGNLTADRTFSINTNGITYALFQQVAASSLVGNPTGALANAQGITLGATLTFSGTSLRTTAMTGDVTAAANSFATTIANNAVTYAKFQQVTASRLLGNPTGGAANASEISLGATFTFSGSALQSTAHTGDVTSAANSNAMTIANSAVTFAKMANLAATSLIGNATGGSAVATAITLGATLSFVGTAIQTAAHTGDVTSSANSFSMTIANAVVTYAKMASSAIASVSEHRSATASKLLDSATAWAAAAEVALTDAATIAVDMATGWNFAVTLGGNRTLGAPTNTKVGQSGYIRIAQDGTGSRTLSFNSVYKFAGGLDPTLTTTASAVDYLYYSVRSSTEIICSIQLNVS